MNTLNISVLLPSSQAAADFQLQVSGALGFSQMRFLNQVVPPGATSTWNSLGRHSEEKALVTHSSTLAWKIPQTEEPGRLQSMGLKKSDMAERLHFHFLLSCIGEGNGNPLQCSCLENPDMAEPGRLPSMGSHTVGHD